MKKIAVFITLMFLLAVPVHADGATEIHTPQDLADMANDPAGSYILAEDIDMAGFEWHCFDFSGTLDGNGHSILNLTVTEPGDVTGVTYDGNLKTYDTYFVGLFSTADHAEIKNLNLVNTRGYVVADTPIFLGSFAGCSMYSTIENCSVSATLELRAHDRMYGVGGVVGYGCGSVSNCNVDVTLICTDTDADTLDEHFLGGVYSTGYMDVNDNTVNIHGFTSDVGYVHDGGITGMHMQYPLGVDNPCYTNRNTVTGIITFFENNIDRRAYCDGIFGELLAGTYSDWENEVDFTRDEHWEHDKELRPDMCENPTYDEKTVPSSCNSFGYTEYTCTQCGYTYTDNYTLKTHQLTNWVETVPATVDSYGESVAKCDLCGLEFTRVEPMVEPTPEPTPAPETPEPTAAPEPAAPTPEIVPEASGAENNPAFIPLVCALGLLAVLLIIYVITKIKKK